MIKTEQFTPQFREELNAMIFRHQEEVYWHGSVDADGGWKLLAKQNIELKELFEKHGVDINGK